VKIGIPWSQLMDSLRAIAGAILAPFMIHELLLSPTETASGSHPCCVVSVTYGLVAPFHGGNTGSNPVGDAKSFQELTGSGHFWRRHKKAQLRRQISGPACLIASVFGHPELFL
jgi:hypothetical protein